MHEAIAAFARAGNDVIIDDLIWNDDVLRHYLEVLAGLSVLMVGVRCSREVVIEREARRPGRFPGTAISHFDEVHRHACYDVEVDTARLTPAQCAERIVARLHAGQFTAFETLRQRYAASPG